MFTLRGRKYLGTTLLFCCLGASVLSGSAYAKKQTLNFIHWYDWPQAKQYMNAQIKLFEQENPGVEVKQTITSWGNGYIDKVLVNAAAGKNFDVIMVSGIWLPALAGILTPVDQLVKLGGFDDKVTYSMMWRCSTWNGKTLGIPFGGGAQNATWYNKDLFSRVGLSPEKPPLTWPEYIEAAKKLTIDTNGDRKTDIYGIGGTVHRFPMMHVAAGGMYTTKGGKAVDFDTPEAIKALEFCQTLGRFKVIGPGNFTSQKVGMYHSGPWDMGDVKKTAKFKWGLFRYPTPTNDNIRMWASADSLGVGKISNAQRNLAWKFVRFLMSTSSQTSLGLDVGFPPMNHTALNTAEYKAAVRENPYLNVGNEMMRYAYAFYPSRRDQDLDTITDRYASMVMDQKIDPRKASADMQREVATLLAKYAK